MDKLLVFIVVVGLLFLVVVNKRMMDAEKLCWKNGLEHVGSSADEIYCREGVYGHISTLYWSEQDD